MSYRACRGYSANLRKARVHEGFSDVFVVRPFSD